MRGSGLERPSRGAARAGLLCLAGILAVTVAWWALALWPTPGVPPSWLMRARQVCFNAGPSGLPDASGWMLLIGQPIGMFAMLMVIAGDAVRAGLTLARRSRLGRFGLAATCLAVLAGASLAVTRTVGAEPESAWAEALDQQVPTSYPRLDRLPPELGLVDQSGLQIDWSRFRGTPVIVTFGFGHCRTVCPLMVHSALRARETLREEGVDVPVVVITLDPWRDTPSRLAPLAEQFMLGAGDHLLSGPVDRVNQVLDGFEVVRERDPKTGDIIHPSLVFVLDADANVAYAATGHAPLVEELVRRVL